MRNFFGNVQHIPGMGYVEVPSNLSGASLGDDASVMMISGVGNLGLTMEERTAAIRAGARLQPSARMTVEGGVIQRGGAAADAAVTTTAALGEQSALDRPINIFGIELALKWWLLLAALGVLGGWYFFYRKR